MENKIIRTVGAVLLVALWGCLAAFAWLGPREEASEAERRPLAQMPEIEADAILNGDFMTDFEDYALDQFPARDGFRKIKALFHHNVLRQLDNNDIYIEGGYAAQQEYPLNRESVERAVSRFDYLYNRYLTDSGSDVYMAVVPDKGYYLAEESGHLALDYEAMIGLLEEGMPWASFVDLTGSLDFGDYYYTDTHWRQEELLTAAGELCEALGVAVPKLEDYTPKAQERPFYGVYYGQAALPMEPDILYLMESSLLDDCVTYVGEWDMAANQPVYTKLYDGVYDREKLAGKDMYETFLSGTQGILRVENPNAATDRELVIIRDSFGSSIAPLLMQGYSAVTLVDIRAVQIDMLSRFVEFEGKDVLFLFSTLVLNNSVTIK